jgi:2Fe-2S ferredoxin
MKVKFVPQNVEFDIKPGESVLHLAQDHGIYIKSVCKGVPSCAECRVRVTEGDYNVMPPGSEELSLIGSGHFIDRRRLSCQLKCFGDITVDMSEQIAKEQNILVGKQKKHSAKDDRVEAVVRRSDADSVAGEEPTESGDVVAASEAGAALSEQRSRPPRDDRGGGDRGGQRGPRDSDRNRGPRPERGGEQQARGGGGNDRGGRSRPGGPGGSIGGPGAGGNRDRNNDRNRDPGAGPSPTRPQAAGGGAPQSQEPREEGEQAAGGESREGGARKRRRRRGKGGGGGGAPTPNAGGPPSRPSAAGPKPPQSES